MKYDIPEFNPPVELLKTHFNATVVETEVVIIASATGCQAAGGLLEFTNNPPTFPTVTLPAVTFIH
jgi:hypothetical protein